MNFKLIQQKITLPLIGALISGVLVAISVPSTSTALAPVGVANTNTTSAGGLPTSLNIATVNAGLPGDISASAIAVSETAGTTAVARSIGLVAANLTSATRTATVLPSGVLSLYLFSSTTVAISASEGHLSSFVEGMGTATTTITSSAGAAGAATATTSVAFTNSATAVAGTISVLYTAPATAGTYYIYAHRGVYPGSLPTAQDPLLGTSFGGVVVTVTTNTTHPSAGGTNGVDISAAINQSLFTAVASNTGINAVIHPTTTLGIGEADALSKGLLYKDATVRTAQSATVLAGGTLSLYGVVNTAVAFSASGGTFASSRGMNNTATVTYNSSNQVSVLNGMTPRTGSTAVATLWTAPTTAGTYTVSLLTGFYQTSLGAYEAPTTSDLPPTLGAKITVSVVAASGGGAYSAAYSACNTATTSAAASSIYPSGVDSSGAVANGDSWFIDFNLKDAYQAALDPGNLVATATNGALVNFGATSGLGTAPTAGTASTDVALQSGANTTLIVTQGTAGAPVTTTVTISYNGTTVCTKTVTIRGKVASLEIGSVGTGSLSSQAGSTAWIEAAAGGVRPAGLFTVLAKDSAGNLVSTPTTLGTYSAVASSLTTVVQSVSVVSPSVSIASSSSPDRFNIGTFLCGDTAGSANVKLKFTTTGTGEIVESPAIAARCASSPYTFTASTDKAAYTQGEIATVTVQFLDSKGNKSNTVVAPGASTFTLPMMTAVDYASSATAVTKADGTVTYKFTVGTTGTFSAGTYTGVISYTGLAASTNATPTYKVSTGGDTTSNSDILKSIVALIASINKQIQALQKLILKR